MSAEAALLWMDEALCAQVDTDIFFPAKGGEVRTAKGICARCPVRAECLDFALEGSLDGIWGGTSPGERAAMRRKARVGAG